MTKREIDTMLADAIEICLEPPDETRERHPQCRWSDTDKLARIDTAARLQDMRAALRGRVQIPDYFARYNIRGE